ncbi:MAG: recombinase family protein [Clostridia bacterium]|nr:recombinase family protein [Clostridia bacterium]
MSTAKKKLTSCPPKTAVAYARYSSHGQRDVSIDQQLHDIRAFAEREGYTIIYEYADRAKSGFKNSDRRAEFQAMLRAAGSGAFDTVIAWKVDRFGRDRRESAMYKGQLSDNGVSVVYAMEPIPEGAAGCLTEGMLEAIAEWYSRNLSENIRRGHSDNASKCMSNGTVSYGYRAGKDGHFEIYEPEAAVVRRTFDLYSHGYSIRGVARVLAEEGIVNDAGTPFCHQRVINMLANESYIGIYHYGDVRTPGGVPRIIDQDLWNACQRLRAKTSRHYEKYPVDFLLTGKCVCGYCSATVTGCSGTDYTKKRRYYYACTDKRRKRTCSLPYIRKEKIENRVMDFLCNQVLTGDLLDSFAESIVEALTARQGTSPLLQLEADLKDTTRRINNINRAISEGIWDDTTSAMLRSLSERSRELNQKIAYQRTVDRQTVSKDRILFYLQKVADGIRDDPEYLKTLVNTFINSVTVYKDWLRIVVNAAENVETIPPESLPPLELLPDSSQFALCQSGSNGIDTVEHLPIIVFKIAI